MSPDRPKVGVAVFIIKDGKFVMTHRQGSHGKDTWGLPGGHLEYGESWEECAKREALEEVGLDIKNVRFLGVTNTVFENEGKHSVTIFMIADRETGQATNLEPQKSKEIAWFTYETMPGNLFKPMLDLKSSYPDLAI
jgi:8-oxo-dGTP diphosphatase